MSQRHESTLSRMKNGNFNNEKEEIDHIMHG